MFRPIKYLKILCLGVLVLGNFSFFDRQVTVDPLPELDYCLRQIDRALPYLDDYIFRPRTIEHGDSLWSLRRIGDWTAGFWPGILWYAYEYSGKEHLKEKAQGFTHAMLPLSMRRAGHHDLGFMIFNSYGHAYRLTGNPEYKEVIIRTADSLAMLFNPVVGTILSWPWKKEREGWPHNTIIDNMMNLEMLFWAAEHGDRPYLYDIAVEHAAKTKEHLFREDFTSYHVCIFDAITGEPIKGVTEQGYSDDSMWARGQAWGIYGFIMVARETGDKKFLDFARKIAQVYIDRLPDDLVPYYDFDAPEIPNEPKDASAAAIFASAMLELSVLVEDQSQSNYYRSLAEDVIKSLSSETYQSRDRNVAFLSHSTGHKPNGTEIDVPMIYADYYYIEALIRLLKISQGKSILE